MDFSNHHRIGPHINIPMQSTENSLWVHAYRASRMPIIPESCGTDVMDLRSRIHCIEKEAYTAVLRAFNVQSDALSWAKEDLITELRKELNITDQEHRRLLADNNSDESLRMIREWRKGSFYTQELPSSRMDDPGFVSSSVGNAPLKISRTSYADVSTLQRYASRSQLTAAANPSHFPIQVQCRDGQRTGELSTFYTRNTQQQSTGAVIPNVMTPSARRHRGTVIPLSKDFHVADVDNLQRKSDIIQIRATDKLLQKVESLIYGRENPNPVQVEKAKSILVEHEGAILEALSKLADVSDGDDSPKQFQYQEFQEELLGIRRGMTMHNSFCAQVDNRLRLH